MRRQHDWEADDRRRRSSHHDRHAGRDDRDRSAGHRSSRQARDYSDRSVSPRCVRLLKATCYLLRGLAIHILNNCIVLPFE